MPVQKTKSTLLAKYGAALDRAIRNHADDEVDYGFQRLPGGIKNGIAKLVEARFDMYKTGNNMGEYFFHARGVVVEPDTVKTPQGDMKVSGLQTSITMPCCATTNGKGEETSQEDNLAKIVNEMKKLAGSEFTAGATGADMESLAASLKELAPYFRFTTSQSTPTKQYPDPRVWENWNGGKGLEDYTPPGDGNGVDDQSEEVDEQEDSGEDQGDEEVSPPPKVKAKQPPTKAPKSLRGTRSLPAKEEFNEFQNSNPLKNAIHIVRDTAFYEGLIEKAEQSDDEAQSELTRLAVEAGATEGQVDSAPNWAAVAKLCVRKRANRSQPKQEEKEPEETGQEQGEDTPTDEEYPPPQIGEVYHYHPVDPKTKKPAKLPTECEIVSVHEGSKTVILRSLDDPKRLFKGVPFDDLKSIP